MTESNDPGPQMSGEPDEPKPSVSELMVRELGLAPGLTTSDSATAQLVESIRSQTDEVVDRAKAQVAREHATASDTSS